MAFQLSDAVNKERVFLVKRSELERRLDPEYVLYLRKSQSFVYPTMPLGNMLKHRPQYGANESGIPRIDKDQPRYVRITDIDEFGLLSENLGATAATIEEKYVLLDGDLLIARSGNTVGKAYLHTCKGYPCFFAGYMIRFKINGDVALPSYVFTITQLGIYKEWVKAVQRSAGQPNINAEEYRNYKIPLPPFEVQRQIVAKMIAAYGTKKQKEAQALQLLDSIDTYLLNELGIKLPVEEETRIHQRMYFRKFSEVSGGRFDGSFYLPRYKVLTDAIRKLSSACFCKLVEFSFEQWDQASLFQGTFPYIEIGEIDTTTGEIKTVTDIDINDAPSRAKMIVRTGDLLVSTTRPTRGAIAFFDGTLAIASTGFCVIKGVASDRVNKMYLFHVLRSHLCLNQMEQRSSGGNYPAITMEELKKVLIPLPPLEKQNEIAAHIQKIRNQAKQLRAEAAAGLEKAKREVETMILGQH